ILAVARNLSAEGHDVVVVTKDVPMRVKASALGLHAEEYLAELATDSGFTGMSEVGLDDEQMSELYDSGSVGTEAVSDEIGTPRGVSRRPGHRLRLHRDERGRSRRRADERTLRLGLGRHRGRVR